MGSQTGLKIFVGIVTTAVIAALVCGFTLSGTPANERARRFDERRLNDLQQISSAIDAYWNTEDVLPENLEILTQNRRIFIESIADPKTSEVYEYIAQEGAKYKLCATYETKAIDSSKVAKPYPSLLFWDHPFGYYCFEFDASEVNSEKLGMPMRDPSFE